jgi:hypothetical protein
VAPRLCWSLVALAATVACATRESAPPAAPPAEAPEHRRLTEVDALEHDLEVAEQRLERELGHKLAQTEKKADDLDEDAAGAPTTPPASGGEGEPAGADQPQKPAEPEWDRAELASPCDQACRALLSMRRSADAICRISGAESERCTRARGRVSRAEQRVRDAGCACRER